MKSPYERKAINDRNKAVAARVFGFRKLVFLFHALNNVFVSVVIFFINGSNSGKESYWPYR